MDITGNISYLKVNWRSMCRNKTLQPRVATNIHNTALRFDPTLSPLHTVTHKQKLDKPEKFLEVEM
jgi:hypothetical protein